jgi:L-fuconolactonase
VAHPENLQITRRTVLGSAVGGTFALLTPGANGAEAPLPIIDSHVHVWDLKQFRLPWLDHAGPVLNRDYSVAEYLKAAEGLKVIAAVYVEVNVEPRQRGEEARYAADLCKRRDGPFVGAVAAADPREAGFVEFLDRFKDEPSFRGIRYLYPAGAADDPACIRGLRALGKRSLTFDFQLSPTLLADAAKTAAACPETRFILDHCGGADPKPFRQESDADPKAREVRDIWRRGVEGLARQPNVWCKISGVADTALPGDATAGDVAPIVNFCLDHFGPDRVLFGGNWPVCLKGTTLRHWVNSLRQIVDGRSEADRRKLFCDNAIKAYGLAGPAKLPVR